MIRGQKIDLDTPANLQASGQTVTAGAVAGANRYRWQRRVAIDQPFQLLGTTESPSRGTVGEGGLSGSVGVRVRAERFGTRGGVEGAWVSDWSAVLPVDLAGGAPPAAPTNLTVTAGGFASWSQVGDDVFHWMVFRKPAAGSYVQVGMVMTLGNPTFQDPFQSGPLTGDYTYQVFAENAVGMSSGSNEYTVTYAEPDAGGENIVTPYDVIYDWGQDANVTTTAVQDGPWSDPDTWDEGVPGATDTALVPAGRTVTYDAAAGAAKTVAVKGNVFFVTDGDTALTVTHLFVYPTGYLRVGTQATPVGADYLAEIVFRDTALNTTLDPRQHGNGLVCVGGKIEMHGAVKTSVARLAAEPLATQTALTLAATPTGWRAGDVVLIPDTDPLAPRGQDGRTEYTEFLTLSANVTTATASLSSAVQHSHHCGGRDIAGTILVYPHAGNLTRNVRVRSENPTGTRGHTLFTMGADVALRRVEFDSLGRTGNELLDNSTFDGSGATTHVGTNQVGKYAVHFHHLHGREDVEPQFVMEDCSVHDRYLTGRPSNNGSYVSDAPKKWGINIHGTSYGLCKNNVIYNYAGSGVFVGEMRSEVKNLIEGNLMVRCWGTGGRPDSRPGDLGFEGGNFWIGNPDNYLVDNYAYTGDLGYIFYPRAANAVPVPNFPGADPFDPAEYTVRNLVESPIGEFSGNEACNFGRGIEPWSIGAAGIFSVRDMPESVMEDCIFWHCYRTIFNYETSRIVWRNCTLLQLPQYVTTTGAFTEGYFTGHYQNDGDVYDGCRFIGFLVGFDPGNFGGLGGNGIPTVVDCSFEGSAANVRVTRNYGDVPWGEAMGTIFQNCTFTDWPLGPRDVLGVTSPHNFVMAQGGLLNGETHYHQIAVIDYNGVPDDNFRLYFPTARRTDTIAQETYNGTQVVVSGPPESGLTNQQSWDKYRVCRAGQLPPANESLTTREKISGWVGPYVPLFIPHHLGGTSLFTWATWNTISTAGDNPFLDVWPKKHGAVDGTVGTLKGTGYTPTWMQPTSARRGTYRHTPSRLEFGTDTWYRAYDFFSNEASGVAAAGALTLYWVGNQTDDAAYVLLGGTADGSGIEITGGDAVRITNAAGSQVSAAWSGRASGRRLMRVRRNASGVWYFAATGTAEFEVGTLTGTLNFQTLFARVHASGYSASGQTFEHMYLNVGNDFPTSAAATDVALRGYFQEFTDIGDIG